LSCDVRPDEPGDNHVTVSSEVPNMKAYRKRIFLNPISEGAPAFIQAVADSSDDGTYKLGNYLLIIADCNRRITLEFALSSKLARKKARAKVDRFAAVVNEFRKRMIIELESIDNGERTTRKARRKTKTSRR
jgi:hypothetical protein